MDTPKATRARVVIFFIYLLFPYQGSRFKHSSNFKSKSTSSKIHPGRSGVASIKFIVKFSHSAKKLLGSCDGGFNSPHGSTHLTDGLIVLTRRYRVVNDSSTSLRKQRKFSEYCTVGIHSLRSAAKESSTMTLRIE
jgi:hypothetical protein